MTSLLSELLSIAQLWLTSGIAIFLRIGTAAILLPGFGESFIPTRVKLVAALAFTVILLPMVDVTVLEGGRILPPVNIFLSEMVIGVLLGIGLRLLVHALQIAGSMAAQATSLAQFGAGVTPDPQPAISAVLMLSGLALAVASGLHVHLATAMLNSYEVFPLGTGIFASDLGHWGVRRVADVFSLAFSLAAPFLIGALLYNLALGVVSKAMPQLMVAFVGAPAITWAALALLLVTAPLILPFWYQALLRAMANPWGAI
ncbi:MAG: flagellar biosynthetic protein FliR [Pseudomonadota bacterium]